jgi:hypothetical protein
MKSVNKNNYSDDLSIITDESSDNDLDIYSGPCIYGDKKLYRSI